MKRHLNLLHAFLKIFLTIYRKNDKRTRTLIHEIEQDLNWSLSSALRDRIRSYTIQSAMTNLWFSTLHQKSLKPHEISTALYLGAFTPCYDDLMDEEGLSTTEIDQILTTDYKKLQGDKAVLSYLYTGILKNTRDKTRFLNQFKRVAKFQQESMEQFNAEISSERLSELTSGKGGESTLLYRTILDEEIDEKEKEMILSLGFALQLINDIFDVYKDLKQEITTSIIKAERLSHLETEFGTIHNDFVQSLKHCNYSQKAKEKFLMLVTPVTSRAQVALKNYRQKNNGKDMIDWKSKKRNELICDMETARNLYSNYLYSLELSKS